MTDEELIKRLRHGEGWPITAADRIEELVKELDRWKDACRSASRDLNIVVPDNDRLKSERDAAEDKLTKAVEAVKNLKSQWHIRDLVNDDFNTVLAELEAGK